MTVKFRTEDMELDPRRMPTGTVLLFDIRYAGTDESARQITGRDTRGRTEPKTYAYAMVKAAGVWYVTGSGKVPTAAGWGAIERWLERDGREVVRVQIVTGAQSIWPKPVEVATTELDPGDVLDGYTGRPY